MTDKKEEWEIGYSRENPANLLKEAKTVNFEKSDSLVGQMLDNRFLIEKDLTESGADEGGIGLVYLARDMKLMGKETVVKILQQAVLENQDIARKFQHEKEALIRLDHPNIVRILDSGYLSDGNPFMVMEYISGYSLRRKIRENKSLPLDFCAHIIESVGNALSAVHAQQILHRDIKPENIMLSPEDEGFERVRLIDFGIARVENSKLAPLTAVERAIGTILYMAPEQLAGTLSQTPAVDIYAFAIVAYEILTGNLPFNPQSMVEMYMLQKEGVKTPPSTLRPDLPKKAEDILLSALAYNPHERPQNARQFGRDLANALLEKNTGADSKKISNGQELAKTLPSPVRTDPSDRQEIQATMPAQTMPSNTVPVIDKNIQTNPSFENVLPIDFPADRQTRSRNKWVLPVAAVGVLGILVIGLIFIAKNWLVKTSTPQVVIANSNTNTVTTSTVRKMQYWLEVQKMRNGQKFDAAFESSGREIFENGYQFRLNFSAPDDGYFYLYNEGKDTNGNVNYNILYPVPLPGKDSAKTGKETTVQSDWNTFGGKAGTEKIWLVWTKDELDVLKDAAKEAFNQQGKVADTKKEDALRKILDENSKQKFNTELEKDEVKKRTILSGEGDKIAFLLELEHK